ncbi:MAG: hypothetical protein WC714_14115 [Candidatus Obscuribacterales bacterium]
MKINISLSANGRKALKVATAALLAVALAVAAWFAVGWYQTPAWPDFAAPVAQVAAGETSGASTSAGSEANQATPGEPKVVVVLKRDYAYHTGDLVKVYVFLKQSAGTVIDPQTLLVNGDFDLVENSSAQKKLDDGSTIYRLDLTVQSLKVAPKVVFTGTVSWKAISANDGAASNARTGANTSANSAANPVAVKRNDLTIPATPVFTSNTYDGRPNLMEGDDPRVSVWWYGARYVVPLVVGSVLFLIVLVGAIKAYLRSRIKPVVVDHARARAVEILAAIKSGTCSRAEHLELDGLVRQRFKTGPVPVSQLNTAIVPGWLTMFLQLNEPAIYAQDALDDDGKVRLSSQGQIVLSYWK